MPYIHHAPTDGFTADITQKVAPCMEGLMSVELSSKGVNHRLPQPMIDDTSHVLSHD